MQVKHLAIVLLLWKKKMAKFLFYVGFCVGVKVYPIQGLEVDEVPDAVEVWNCCDEGGGLRPAVLEGLVCPEDNLEGQEGVEDRPEQVESGLLIKSSLVK